MKNQEQLEQALLEALRVFEKVESYSGMEDCWEIYYPVSSVSGDLVSLAHRHLLRGCITRDLLTLIEKSIADFSDSLSQACLENSHAIAGEKLSLLNRLNKAVIIIHDYLTMQVIQGEEVDSLPF